TVAPGASTLITARVTAATNPTSTSVGVTANLSALGGSKSQRLRDNGLTGDAVAGDGIFSFRQTVGSSVATGAKSVRIAVNDAQGRSASATAGVTVGAAEPSVSPFGSATASPSSLLAGESSLLTVRVTAGTGPASTGLTVSSDLSSLGLGASQAFNDAGQNGDAVAGDGTYSVRATVPGAASTGTRTLSARIADAQGRSSTAGFSLTVNAAPAQTEPPVTSAAAPQACANFYTASFALPQGQQVSTVPGLGKPVKGTSWRDPVHGTCGIRVTDHAVEAPSGMARHDYSRRQAFNVDNSYLLVQATNGFWHLYNANTMAFIRTLSGPAGDAEIQWHPTDPKSLYYFDTNGGMVLRQLNVDTGTITAAANFAGKLPWADAARVWTKSEGAPSADGRYWCLMAETSSFAIRGVIVYDLQTQTVVGSRALSARPDHTGMSASGRWCVVSHLAGSGGTVAWDRSFTTSRQLHSTSEHSDLALNAQGQDVYVAVDYQANAGDFFMHNIDTNVRTNLFPTYISGSATAYHVSGQAFAKPGWVLVSTYGASGSNQWLHNKLMAVELKSGGRILNIGHHQSRLSGYWTEPQASVNRDFTRVIWASNFGTTSDTDIDAYMMYLPPSAIPAAQ
ncbi:MAG: choice-of-anchor X domain-containing protein, partial [Dermatophilaceae bacterium]